jgi:FlaG/FlaF family flagellin (archaellin)
MSIFSDAALLKGKFAHMAAEFRHGKRQAPKTEEWQAVACDNTAEQAAQEVAKHIFGFQQSIDPKQVTLEVIAICPAGAMKVISLVPGEGDIIRIDGMLIPEGAPSSTIVHVSQLSLSFITRPVVDENEDPDDDGLQIGFVIFEELAERKKARELAKNKQNDTTNEDEAS